MMKHWAKVMGAFAIVLFTAGITLGAYHHLGEQDSDTFLSVYPDKAGTKLDHCALCHCGGAYEKKPGVWISMGSCQWCHYTYGFNGSGNIIDTLNPYGLDYLYHGRNLYALAEIETMDSDQDGYSNIVEIRAVRYPGDSDDDPGKVPAPSVVYSKDQLEALPQHTEFLLMNTNRSGDFYAEYTGVPMDTLLEDAKILDSATGITVFAPDGWSTYHPLEWDSSPVLYPVRGIYPDSVFYYDPEADIALNPEDGWCDYSAPSCQGLTNGSPIVVPGGLQMILAIKREGAYLEPGVLNQDNRLDGEGPYRVVVPQKEPSPPDQLATAANQEVIWPYNEDWDHNAGYCSRSVTIIRVEPLPEGTTDINVLEAGWNYIDEEKIVVYGAIEDPKDRCDFNGNGSIGFLDKIGKIQSLREEYQYWRSNCWLPQGPCGDFNQDGIIDWRDPRAKIQSLKEKYQVWHQKCWPSTPLQGLDFEEELLSSAMCR